MNRRSIKTRREITDAFLKLLSEKPIRSITVKEIADMADITRATFYSHFKDIYDLLDYTRTDAIDHIVTMLDRSMPFGDTSSFCLELFSYFEERSELFSLIMGENGDISFLVSAMRELRDRQIDNFKEGPKRKKPNCSKEMSYDYQFLYISGGVLHILTEWFTEEERRPAEEVAAITAELIESSISPG